MDELNVYTDGGSRGNPGMSAIGVLICGKDGKILKQHSEFLGRGTNNTAEYTALIKALKIAGKLSGGIINCFSDSQLMVRQLTGMYKVKNYSLKKLFLEVKDLEKKFEEVNYIHVNRENKKITIVDKLVNEMLDTIKK
ncbi:MAG: ribonuclease H [Candidatus Aenigmarchaeota archaeon CG_4_10_14_0_8_um_filter_37_24]|nr:ribonuclease HI family protein [Candidatus Aenigmarchaeota archaeon]PIW41250.1 MAG: ribonuclease H [Candidatus Aenigmarchaeota archaeon CG15_BIG_FIL_POST_REV_8_21_14_020_37_27]PIX50524.1 MAG: ribonuclease H [Candidatus Aenigmarchaeota archaeon CG_4_8_14_3_um_filter_37_24]PIY35301.1 MAG: ribonuclease H [Candidatus Aenigmarchaeota archaeon CG_4_10_14_3_um_filter_37_21]PIZ36258.1 MAG: ribonuclease H [Candidatus Aenigmarchaeota archaeon CG_4_10_14_0_8_um_filter_37_24]PJB75340.1 MAG: ribonucleas